MIAMMTFDGTLLGLYPSIQEIKEEQENSPTLKFLVDLENEKVGEEIIYREVSTLEELKDLMDRAGRFYYQGVGEPI